MDSLPADLMDYVRSFASIKFDPNSVIFREGEKGTNAFIVADGEVIICGTNNHGELVHLTTLTKGCMFGELALFHDDKRTATAITETGCDLVVIQRSQLSRKLLDADPLVRFWVEYLASRVIDLSNRVAPR